MAAIKDKIFQFLMLAVLAYTTLYVQGQDYSQHLNRMVSIQGNRLRLDSLLNNFTRQTQIDFSFNSNKINPAAIIYTKNKKQTLAEWLLTLQHDIGIHYSLLGDHIILVNDPQVFSNKLSRAGQILAKGGSKPGIPNAGYRPKMVIKNSGNPVIGKPLTSRAIQNAGENKAADTDTILKNNYLPAYSLPGTEGLVKSPVFDTSGLDNEISSTNDTARVFASVPGNHNNNIHGETASSPKQRSGAKKGTGKFVVRPGISLSEVFYFNTTLEIGSPFLYGHLSWNTNFTTSCVRYGAGTSIRLKNGLDLNIQVTFGKLSKYFIVDTSHRILSRNKLTRVGFLLERKLNNWRVRFGPVVNYLGIYYYENGQPYSFSNPVKSAEKPFYIIKPPYFLSNSYTSGSVANLKLWVGLQVDLVYNIPFL
ncbi:MAG: hypothetical protein ABI416_17310 [Ginsengibacter sp.]